MFGPDPANGANIVFGQFVALVNKPANLALELARFDRRVGGLFRIGAICGRVFGAFALYDLVMGVLSPYCSAATCAPKNTVWVSLSMVFITSQTINPQLSFITGNLDSTV